MITDPLAVVLVLGVWLAFLWFGEFRTIRTVALLSLATAILAGSSYLPELPRLLVGAVIAAALLAIHFRYHSWILAYTSDEQAFDSDLCAISGRLALAHESLAAAGDRKAFRDALEQAVVDLEALHAPGPEWMNVKTMAINLVRERLRVHDSQRADAKARFHFRSERAALHESLRLARVKTARFWR